MANARQGRSLGRAASGGAYYGDGTVVRSFRVMIRKSEHNFDHGVSSLEDCCEFSQNRKDACMVVVCHSIESLSRIVGKVISRSRSSRNAWSIAASGVLISTLPLLAGGELATSADRAELRLDDVARVMAETARVTEVALAPDGTCVVYTVKRGNVEANSHTSELMLQELDAQGKPLGAPNLVTQLTGKGAPGFQPEWRPRSRSFSYRAPQGRTGTIESSTSVEPRPLVLYDVDSGTATPLTTRGEGEQRAPRVGLVYQWSPSGRFLAFTARVGKNESKLDPRGGVVQSRDIPWQSDVTASGIYILDVSSGKLEQVTPDDLAVAPGLEWSPDEKQIVFVSGERKFDRWFFRGRLQVVDLATRSVRMLVASPTYYNSLKWSPDGKTIAFADIEPTKRGRGEFGLATVSALTPGKVTRLGSPGSPSVGDILAWTPDSKALYYSSGYHMASELVRVEVADSRVTFVTRPDDSFTDRQFSLSADLRRVAYLHSSYSSPAEVYVQGLPDKEAHATTSVSSDFPFRDLVRIERVSWPSQDGKFTIHGMLLIPNAALRAGETRPMTPLPTVVFSYGGPGMVNTAFDTDGYHGGMLPLAVRGYAVLTANTRGRGGYGEDLMWGMARDKAHNRGPYQDLMAGVDMLVKNGVADPERLGVFGHSYGANLTTYIITQTNRFKAAAIHEALQLDLMRDVISMPGGRYEDDFYYMAGVEDPLSEETTKGLIEDSARLYLGRIRTPTLLQFGAHSAAKTTGQTLFNTMLRLQVPSEFVVYDSGHGVEAAAAVADELTRVGAWFDFWVREMPYPDKARATEYVEWRSARERTQPRSH